MQNNSYIEGVINSLLRAIDDEDWDSLGKLLHHETVYEVSGFPRFEGSLAVMDYYENIRPIKSGSHSIDRLIKEGDWACCTGRFAGVKKDGEKVELLFSDALEFEDFKIKQRRVYFCIPVN